MFTGRDTPNTSSAGLASCMQVGRGRALHFSILFFSQRDDLGYIVLRDLAICPFVISERGNERIDHVVFLPFLIVHFLVLQSTRTFLNLSSSLSLFIP